MRINARLDEHSEKNLEFIKKSTGENITQILKNLLEERAKQLRQKQNVGGKFKSLLGSEFVGCAEGKANLSENYKEAFYQGIKEKHDID
jgi:hypothetical protein